MSFSIALISCNKSGQFLLQSENHDPKIKDGVIVSQGYCSGAPVWLRNGCAYLNKSDVMQPLAAHYVKHIKNAMMLYDYQMTLLDGPVIVAE